MALAPPNWEVLKTLPLGGTGSWDYLTIDPQSHRLYIPRSIHTMVVDPDGKILGDIAGQKIAHGVAVVPSVGRGFISDGGGDGAIVVFDLKTFETLGILAAQPDADGIIYDPFTGLVLVVSGDKGTLMTFKPDIDVNSGKIDTPLDLGGAPEFLAADGKGKVYINLMDKNEVAVVDIKARKVIARWPVAPGGAPVGMAIDTQRHRIFLGCRKPQKLIVMSTETGNVIGDMPIGEGVDAVKFHQGQIFASCRDSTLAVAAETSPGKFEIVETVKTPYGARTMGLDPGTEHIYLPTAEFGEARPGAKGRPTKPNTFMVVVVGHHGH
jgi:hypothetical protein